MSRVQIFDILQVSSLVCLIGTTFLGTVWRDDCLNTVAIIALVVFALAHGLSRWTRPKS